MELRRLLGSSEIRVNLTSILSHNHLYAQHALLLDRIEVLVSMLLAAFWFKRQHETIGFSKEPLNIRLNYFK